MMESLKNMLHSMLVVRRKNILIVVALAAFFFIYRGAIGNYFFQDDFYFLRLSRIENPVDFLKFFSPWHQQGFPAYRPLGTQIYFFLGQLFLPQFSPYILRLVLFLFHFTNFGLIFKILKKLFPDRGWLLLVLATTYLIAPLHFLSLYYLAAFQQVLAAFFQLLGFYFYLNKRKKAVYFCFIFALLSKETAVVYPALLFLFSLFLKRKFTAREIFYRFKKEAAYWLGFLLIIIFYGLIRYLTFSQGPGNEYQLSLSLRTFFSSIRWYLVWLLGAPETIINYAGRGFAFDWSSFLKDTKILGYLFTGTFLAEVALLCLILVKLIIFDKDRKKILLFLVWFGAWFVVSLSPVSFFPYHRYSHYLDMAFLALLLVTAGIILRRSGVLPIFLVGIFVLNAYFAVNIDSKLHWAPARSKIAAEYYQFFKNENICNNSQGIYFIDTKSNSAKEVAIALSFADGPRYFCQNYQLPVFYQGVNEPSEEGKNSLFKIESKIR